MERMYATVLVAIVGLSWAVQLVVHGSVEPKNWAELLQPFSVSVTVLVGAVLIFDKVLWKITPDGFRRRPVIEGVWVVQMTSNFKDPSTGIQIPPIDAFLYVYQTFSTTRLTLLSDKSRSSSVAHSLSRAEDGSYRLYALYRNEPSIQERDRSPIHYGALILEVPAGNVASIEGSYFTDRETTGSFKAHSRRKGAAHSFEAAKTLFGLQV